MPVIDAHHHIWRQVDLPWLVGPMLPRIFGPYEPIRRDYPIEEYLADIAGADVVESVYVQANWALARAEDEVAWVQTTADATGWPHAIVGYADLLADPAAALEKLLCHAGLRMAPTDCQDIIGAIWPDRSSLRFNQGRQGRAAGYFGADHRSRLERMLSHYPAAQARAGELLGY